MAQNGAPRLQLEWLKVACTIQPVVSVLVATISATALATLRPDGKTFAAADLYVANLHAASFFCAISSVLVANQVALLPCICLQVFRATTPERVKQVVCYGLWIAGALLVCSLCTLSLAIMATADLPIVGAAIWSGIWGLVSALSIIFLLYVDNNNQCGGFCTKSDATADITPYGHDKLERQLELMLAELERLRERERTLQREYSR